MKSLCSSVATALILLTTLLLVGCQTNGTSSAAASSVECPYCKNASQATTIAAVAYNKTVCPHCQKTANTMWAYEHHPAQVYNCASCKVNVAACPTCAESHP